MTGFNNVIKDIGKKVEHAALPHEFALETAVIAAVHIVFVKRRRQSRTIAVADRFH